MIINPTLSKGERLKKGEKVGSESGSLINGSTSRHALGGRLPDKVPIFLRDLLKLDNGNQIGVRQR
jgi:hypothetical protein